MRWEDRIMEALVGRQLADQSETRRLEKKYAGVGEALKQVTTVACETTPLLESSVRARRVYTRAEGQPWQSSLRPMRPPIQRAQSELQETKHPMSDSPSKTPDITAMNLTEDQLKRTYSESDIWDASRDTLPPLPQMEGFGRYRCAVDADPDWKVQKIRDGLRDIRPLIEKFDNFVLVGSQPSVWKRYQESVRSDSFASNRSSKSASSAGFVEDRIDPLTGTHISRGFTPSNSSSGGSSFRDAYKHMRKNSGLSMTSLSGGTDDKLIRVSSRQSALRLALSGGSDTLTPIGEDEDTLCKQYRKTEKPCVFDAEGDMANALESDSDEDDLAVSSDWVDATMSIHTSGALTENFHTIEAGKLGQKHLRQSSPNQTGGRTTTRHNKTGIDRSRTIRAAAKPYTRRTHSQHQPGQPKRNITNENIPNETKQLRRDIPAEHALSFDDFEEAKENPIALGLDIPSTKERGHLVASSDQEDAGDDTTSRPSDSETGTSKPIQISYKEGMPLRSRRARSVTAIRVFSEHLPAVTRTTPNGKEQAG